MSEYDSHWNDKEIAKLAVESKPNEKNLILFLSKLLIDFTDIEVRSGVSDAGEYQTFDIEIYLNDRKNPKLLLKIECECGNKGNVYWGDTIPYNWSGLNLLERKYYKLPVKADIFIKHNEGLTSGFAFDNRWIEKLIWDGTLKLQKERHSLTFNTCDTVFKVPFKFAKNNPESAVICERSNFSELREFLKYHIIKVAESRKYE